MAAEVELISKSQEGNVRIDLDHAIHLLQQREVEAHLGSRFGTHGMCRSRALDCSQVKPGVPGCMPNHFHMTPKQEAQNWRHPNTAATAQCMHNMSKDRHEGHETKC